MAKEYKTTTGVNDPPAPPHDPRPPEGEGWEFVSFAAIGARLLWVWQREVADEQKAAQDKPAPERRLDEPTQSLSDATGDDYPEPQPTHRQKGKTGTGKGKG